MYQLYLKIAFRYFQSHKIYTLVSTLLLAVALSSALLIITWVNNELSTDKFHPNINQLYLVTSKKNPDVEKWRWFGYACGDILKSEYPEIIGSAPLEYLDENLLSPDDKTWYRLNGFATQQDFFKMFGFRILHGNKDNALENTNSIVLTRNSSEKIFGMENSVGKTLLLRSRENLTFEVSAIIESVPGNSSIQFDYLVHQEAANWSRMAAEIILLEEEVNLSEVNEKIKYASRKSKYSGDEESIIRLFPLAEIYFNSDFYPFTHGNKNYPKILFFIAIIILTIGVLNYISLALAISVKRSRNIGIKKVLGSSRISLILQNLTETFLLTALAIAIAIITTKLLLPFLSSLIDKDLNFEYSVYSLTTISIITFLLTFILAGFIPAILYSSFKPVLTLKGMLTTGSSIRFFRISLVVLLFGCTIILIISTAFLRKQLNYMQSKELGYDKENIVKIQFIDPNSSRQDFKEFQKNILLIENELESYPGITCFDNGNFPTKTYTMDWRIPGDVVDEQFTINTLTVGTKYAELFNLKVIEGSFFSESDNRRRAYGDTSITNIVINQKAAEFLHLDDPCGTPVENLSWGFFNIKGVVEDFHNEHLSYSIKPLIMVCLPYKEYPLLIKMQKGTLSESMKFIEELFYKVNTRMPFEYEFFDQHLDMMYKKDQLMAKIFTGFSMISIILAVIALFSFASHSLNLKSHEISIRKVFGAKVSTLLIMLTTDYMKFIFIAFIIACPITYYFMQKWLENFAYRINLSWYVFLIAGTIPLIIGLLTIVQQCIKAAKQNPVESLRYE